MVAAVVCAQCSVVRRPVANTLLSSASEYRLPFGANIVGLALIIGIVSPAFAQQNQDVITLERALCYGSCPAYLLQIDSSGTVSFQQGPPSNRHEEQTSHIASEKIADLMAGFISIGFFELNDVYKPIHTDDQQTYIQVSLAGKTKRIAHFENGPPELRELERKVEVLANTHRWLHGDARAFTLASPLAGPLVSRLCGGTTKPPLRAPSLTSRHTRFRFVGP
jgi:hypothetical protein